MKPRFWVSMWTVVVEPNSNRFSSALHPSTLYATDDIWVKLVGVPDVEIPILSDVFHPTVYTLTLVISWLKVKVKELSSEVPTLMPKFRYPLAPGKYFDTSVIAVTDPSPSSLLVSKIVFSLVVSTAVVLPVMPSPFAKLYEATIVSWENIPYESILFNKIR